MKMFYGPLDQVNEGSQDETSKITLIDLRSFGLAEVFKNRNVWAC